QDAGAPRGQGVRRIATGRADRRARRTRQTLLRPHACRSSGGARQSRRAASNVGRPRCGTPAAMTYSPATPPPRALRLLERVLPADVRDALTGDLIETFARTADARGPRTARLRFWAEALGAVWQCGAWRAALRGRSGLTPAFGLTDDLRY